MKREPNYGRYHGPVSLAPPPVMPWVCAHACTHYACQVNKAFFGQERGQPCPLEPKPHHEEITP